jgi:DNA-binding GntR family transcriptional regulator
VKKKDERADTLAEKAYRAVKTGILRGEFAEGTFLSEAEVASRYGLGRTPFREACNRLFNEQFLDVVPRRGFLVRKLSFGAVRDLLETRLILEGVAAEMAAVRAEPPQIAELEALYGKVLASAKNRDIDALVESNREFHLQIARMAHNGELESLLRGVLERVTRLLYLAGRSSAHPEHEAQIMLRPIVEALKARNPAAAHEAVVNDIARGQLNVFGRDLWAAKGSSETSRTVHVLARDSMTEKES